MLVLFPTTGNVGDTKESERLNKKGGYHEGKKVTGAIERLM